MSVFKPGDKVRVRVRGNAVVVPATELFDGYPRDEAADLSDAWIDRHPRSVLVRYCKNGHSMNGMLGDPPEDDVIMGWDPDPPDARPSLQKEIDRLAADPAVRRRDELLAHIFRPVPAEPAAKAPEPFLFDGGTLPKRSVWVIGQDYRFQDLPIGAYFIDPTTSRNYIVHVWKKLNPKQCEVIVGIDVGRHASCQATYTVRYKGMDPP